MNKRKRSKSLRTQIFQKQLYNKWKDQDHQFFEAELYTMDSDYTQAQHKSPRQSSIWSKFLDLVLNRRVQLHTKNGRQIPLCLDNKDSFFLTYCGESNILLDETTNKPYINNAITSSRYTIYSFFPRQLYAQFSKLANTYFFIVAILQMIPSWSTTGTFTTIIPLSIFIGISMTREAYDDLRRHRLDKEENNKVSKILLKSDNCLDDDVFVHKSRKDNNIPENETCESSLVEDELNNLDEDSFTNIDILRINHNIHLVTREWKELKVGDFVYLNKNDWVPADLLLISCDGENNECFVETMALDGETNLKNKHPLSELSKNMSTASGLAKFKGLVTVEDPNIDLYNFEGKLKLGEEYEKEIPISIDNIIYRGSIIRNTENLLGMVIFTGEETKIRMNAIKNPRTKAPKLQSKINIIVIFMVFIVASMSLFSFLGERVIKRNYLDNNRAWYLLKSDAGIAPTIMSFIIMYNTLIPLSLYVTMEIIKVIQSKLMEWDIDMYHPETNTRCESRTATIVEELGQVSYLFSDKTGTLTENQMIFKKFCISGSSWEHDLRNKPTECANKGITRNEDNDMISMFNENLQSFELNSIELDDNERDHSYHKGESSSICIEGPSVEMHKNSSNLKNHNTDLNHTQTDDKLFKLRTSLDLINYIQENPNSLFAQRAKFFILSLALCHSCLPKTHLTSDGCEIVEYQSSSPDELALVNAAKDLGYIVFNRHSNILTLKTYPNGFDNPAVLEDYEILDYIEFNSQRKRMSVLVRMLNDSDKILLICKGADNVIMERLYNADLAQQKQDELTTSLGQRKIEEATIVLQQKKSLEYILARETIGSGLRKSLSSRPDKASLALQAARISLSKKSMTITDDKQIQINSIGDFLSNVQHADLEVGEIYNRSRRSMQQQQLRKYSQVSQELESSSILYPDTSSNIKETKVAIEEYIGGDELIQNEEYLIERALTAIDEFSTEGLRTLLYAFKWIDINEYNVWSAKYQKAKTTLNDRREKVDQIGEEIENGLNLLGVTAIEDKLQEGVAESIVKLRRAGIKIWMLTGDKRETAINIGYSCKIIYDYSTLVILTASDDNLTSKMTALTEEIENGNVAHCVVVVDGTTLALFESNPTLMSVFVELCTKTDSVICCRASPSQKALMVTNIKNTNKSLVTLAIGDGANDIAMIQSADIGVGISGKEGLQASRSSDYSIAQFRFLIKLLFVHGHYNYIRTSKFVLCTFYKELFFYLTQMIFQMQTMFSGTSLYEPWSLSMFNTLFTSLPVLCLGIFEKDLKPMTLLSVPELYTVGRTSKAFNLIIFIQWMITALCFAVLLTFLNWYCWSFTAQSDNSLYPAGVLNFTAIVTLINFKCQFIEMRNRNWLAFTSVLISVGGWLLWCCLLPAIYKQNSIYDVITGLYHHFGRDITFWCSILVLIVFLMIIEIIFKTFKIMVWPSDSDIFSQLEQKDDIRKKLEFGAFSEMKQGWTWSQDPSTITRYINTYIWQKENVSNHDITHIKPQENTLTETEQCMERKNINMINNGKTFNVEEYEMLPSGKLIKRKKLKPQSSGDSAYLDKVNKKLRFKLRSKKEDIDDIIEQRMRDIE